MYYIRLIKNPSISYGSEAHTKKRKKNEASSKVAGSSSLQTLLTITTDLGESFYPYEASLDVSLLLDSFEIIKNDASNHTDENEQRKAQVCSWIFSDSITLDPT